MRPITYVMGFITCVVKPINDGMKPTKDVIKPTNNEISVNTHVDFSVQFKKITNT
jgi:hypothetical protein